MTTSVVTLNDIEASQLSTLLSKYNLILTVVKMDEAIPGSFWGDSEAGLVDNLLYVRLDTPIHSLFHEACHYICMDAGRRNKLHTDAGGDYDEENGVCYLQIVLADAIKGMGSPRMMQDMDSWGYTFRLGSAAKWFEDDAEDAKQWLLENKLLDSDSQPTFELRH